MHIHTHAVFPLSVSCYHSFIAREELAAVLKMMVGSNLDSNQIEQIVTKVNINSRIFFFISAVSVKQCAVQTNRVLVSPQTISEADKDLDGKINFEEFRHVVNEQDIAEKMTIQFQ